MFAFYQLVLRIKCWFCLSNIPTSFLVRVIMIEWSFYVLLKAKLLLDTITKCICYIIIFFINLVNLPRLFAHWYEVWLSLLLFYMKYLDHVCWITTSSKPGSLASGIDLSKLILIINASPNMGLWAIWKLKLHPTFTWLSWRGWIKLGVNRHFSNCSHEVV